MSLLKAIQHGKEHRRSYRGGKAVFHDCRNHGGCPFCEGNRKHSNLRRLLSCEQQIAELNDPPVEIKGVQVRRPWSHKLHSPL
jgi:hypothetical protein